MIAINEEDIKKVLGERKILLKNIHKRILDMYDELSDTDSLIRSVSIKKTDWEREGSSKGGTKKDLLDVMLMHQQLNEEREIEVRTEMSRLTEEEESINRIWVCFRSLRGREYTYIDKLYVQQLPYKAVEAESNVSHRTFEKIRSSGLKRILHLYESEINNLQIINLSGNQNGNKQVLQNKQRSGYEQMKLEI